MSTASAACASSPSRLRHFSLDEAALHRQFVHRPAERLPGDRLGDTGQLEHHPARLDVGDPPLWRALARAHPGLSRLLGQRPVRVDGDPHLAATADVPRHRDTSRLNLPVGHVRMLNSLNAVLAERHPGAALGGTVPVRPAVLTPPRYEHGSALLAGAAGRCCRGVRCLRRPLLGTIRRPGPAGAASRTAPASPVTPVRTARPPPSLLLLLRRAPGPLAGPQGRGLGLPLEAGPRAPAAGDPHPYA